jgi:DNA polymerase III subunit epsilon
MREIIFDTETTGLDSGEDRIIEIGAIELDRHVPTGRTFHVYINPVSRKVHPDALAIHGITDDFLKDKPTFDQIAPDLLAFFEGAKWIAHNASFDMGFVNAELARLEFPPVSQSFVIDTLALARRKHPMGPNSLDALCRRYGIDNSHRTKHGALLDSELLAEVYLEMIGGKQSALSLSGPEKNTDGSDREDISFLVAQRPNPLPSRLTAADLKSHSDMLATMKGKPVWNFYESGKESGS